MVILKKSHNKLIWRGISKSLNRFFSIMGIVAIGSGFLAGLVATTPDMKSSADRYFDQNNIYDLDIKGTLGITQADADALKTQPDIEKVMPAYVTDAILNDNLGNSYNTRIFGILDQNGKSELNNVVLLKGRMPENENECVIEIPSGYSSNSVNLDTVLNFSRDNPNFSTLYETYNIFKYRVVGIVESPMFISIESERSTVGSGKVAMAAYVYKSCYSMPVYTDLYATINNALQLNTFSTQYTNLATQAADNLEAFGKSRSQIRYNSIRSDAQTKLNEALAEYNQKKSLAETELNDALNQITTAKKQISDGEAAIATAETTIQTQKNELESGWAQLSTAETQYNNYLQQYNSQNAVLAAQKPNIDLLKQYQLGGGILTTEQINAIAQYDAAELALQNFALQLNSSKAQIEASRTQLINGDAQIKAAETEIANKKADLNTAKQLLETSQNDYNTAKQNVNNRFTSAKADLDQAQADIDALTLPKWIIFDRSSNTGYKSYQSNVEKVAALAKVFPVFFFLVAALVALTTMTRMVEEERTQIGTLKSLGYSSASILKYYMIYSGTASVLGCILGFAIGFKVFPAVISNAYKMMFNVPKIETPIIPSIAAVVGLCTIVCIMLTTFFACKNELRERPAALMVARAPKVGKRILLERITFFWKKLSFTHKVTARNLFRYKKRLFMTIIGVSGCSALLLTGFGIRDSINDIVDKQFNEIYKYNFTMVLENESDISTDDIISTFLNNKTIVEEYLPIHSQSVTVETKNDSQSVTLTIPKDTERLKDFITLRQRKSGEDIPFNESSVVITEKLSETLGADIGDYITVKNDDGDETQLCVSGITENYVTSYLYISPTTYQNSFNKSPDFPMIISRVNDNNGTDSDAISALILNSDNVIYSSFSSVIQNSFANSVKSIDYIVIVLIIAAGLLSVIVLYNLTNVNICERKKELATIKVLGFFDNETQKYIFREINILSIVGTLVGLVLGIWLHMFVIRTVEIDAVMFGRCISPLSFIYATAISIGFTLLVNLIMRKRIKDIDMVEAMKAND